MPRRAKRHSSAIACFVFCAVALAFVQRKEKPQNPYAVLMVSNGLPPLELPRDYRFTCGDALWHGSFPDEQPPRPSPQVSIILNYCTRSLDWLDAAIRGLNVRRITVYPKCGQPVRGLTTLPDSVAITIVDTLPHVGRCDHTYAHHMANFPPDTDPEEIQLFLKDTYPEHHQKELAQRSLVDTVAQAAGPAGFSCGSMPKWRLTYDHANFPSMTWFHTMLNLGADMSYWHVSSEMAKYQLRAYKSTGNYAFETQDNFASNLSFTEWWSALGVRMPGPIMPVCFAATFAVKPANIVVSRPAWVRMERLLERGANLEEGHYAERTYAALLTPALPPRVVVQLKCASEASMRTVPLVSVGSCGMRGAAGDCGTMWCSRRNAIKCDY